MARQQVNGDEIRRLRVEVFDLTPMSKFIEALAAEGAERNVFTIYNIELGYTQPSDELLNAMARVFGVRRETLLLRTSPEGGDTP